MRRVLLITALLTINALRISRAESLPGLTLSEVLARIQDVQGKMNDVQFDFVETLGKGATSHELEGRVSFKRPYHLRVDQSSPEKQVLWSDGKKLWLFTPSAGQQLTGAWTQWLSRSGFPAPLLGFIADFKLSSWSDKYRILFGGYDNHLYKVIFKPKSADNAPLAVWISDESFLPVRGILDAGALPVEVKFEEWRVNQGLRDNLFDPSVPAGTAIVPLPS